MASGADRRVFWQFGYACVLAAAGVALLVWLSVRTPPDFHSLWHLLGFFAFTLFIVERGFPAPGLGHISLDRVAQVSALLVFGPVEAAWINLPVSLIWPFLNLRRQPAPVLTTATRALQNAGMFTIMLLGAGYVYTLTGGSLPLRSFGSMDFVPLFGLALAMQAVNQFLFTLGGQFVGISIARSFSWRTNVFDLGIVPLGIFTALVFNLFPLPVFLLYAVLLLALVWVVRRFADTRRQLEMRLEELVAVNRIGKAIGSSLILDDLVEVIYQECRKLFDFSAFYLILYDDQAQEMDFRLHHNNEGRQPRKRKKVSEGILGWIITHNRPVLIENWAESSEEVRRIVVIVGDEPLSFLGVPVSYGGRVLGVISIQSYQAYAFTQYDLDLMQTFAGQVAVAIANANLYSELEQYKHQLEYKVEERTRELNQQKEELRKLSDSLRHANTEKERLLGQLEKQTKEDSLTGLFNRRYVDSRLETELRRAERFGHPAAVAFADIDHFKMINDQFSHMVGDDVLREIANLLRRQCRAIDVIARYGGEEFLLYFPETTAADAAHVCEKIRLAIEQHDWRWLHPELGVTISIGVTGAPPDYGADFLLSAADAKLYEAKRGGRNRVCA